MDLEQAKRILNISAEDDAAAIKKKYRRLIGRHHPDAIGSDKPEHVDGKGREIYRFRAFLGARGQSQVWKVMASLQKGDVIYPESFQGSRIADILNRYERALRNCF